VASGAREPTLTEGASVPGRNEPCRCGSGMRYKDCHGSLAPPPAKVAFLIAGTQKGGTSALASYLYAHPSICMSAIKEVHFFDDDEHFATGEVDYARYHAHFAPKERRRLLGEATPIYMYWESAPKRIQDYNPAMKLIMLLRNPVTRAYSHWNWNRKHRRGQLDPLSFEEAIAAEEGRRADAQPLQDRRFSYVDRGFYSPQIRRIWRHFPVGQTLILRSEELQNAPQTALAKVTDFLGVERCATVGPRTVNARPYEAPMSADARRRLCDVFAPEIRTLEQMFGWDCSHWLAP
jgi:hypothetical protein